MAKKVDKKSADNPQNWKIAQRYIRIEHNQTVVQWFRVSNSIARTNLRNSLLIYNKDTASQMLVKMQFFAQYIQKTDDELLSLPLQFKTRVLPNIPQLAIIFRPTDKKIRTGNYTLHIPHYIVKVKPIRADYYKDGKKNNPVPDWKYYFR